MRIVITNTKGGVGKTTSAIYLATALSGRGSVQVYDADPQGSATEWAMRAADDGDPLPFRVDPINLAQLRRVEDTAEFTVFDTAPGDPRIIDAALEAADVAVIPTRPSGIDLSRVWDTERVAAARVSAYVLVTQADARTRSVDAALKVLDEQGVGRFETIIPMREAIRQSFGTCPGPDLHRYDEAASELLEEER